MKRWEAQTENKDFVTEDDLNWELVKDKCKSLSLNNDKQMVTLPKNMEYVQGKSACASFGDKEVEILSRYIGVIYKDIKFLVRVDEKTNDISIEITDL